jgi:hypothetical protein
MECVENASNWNANSTSPMKRVPTNSYSVIPHSYGGVAMLNTADRHFCCFSIVIYMLYGDVCDNFVGIRRRQSSSLSWKPTDNEVSRHQLLGQLMSRHKMKR